MIKSFTDLNAWKEGHKLIFYYNACGSVLEVQNCLLAARDTGVLKSSHDFQRVWNQSEICYQKLNGLIASTAKQIV